jgi:hypothetical protein
MDTWPLAEQCDRGAPAALPREKHRGRRRPVALYSRCDDDPRTRFAARATPWALALLLGALASLLASLTCTPGLDLTGDLGRAYAELARDPLATDPHPVPGRIFTATVSWLVGLRGADVVWTMLAACLLLPVLVARWALRRGHCPGEALLVATAVSATLVVRTTLHYGGYPDAVTHLGLLAVWLLRRRPAAVTIVWLLTLLDHERALLMLPWALVMVSGWGEDPGRPRRVRSADVPGPACCSPPWRPRRCTWAWRPDAWPSTTPRATSRRC